MFCSSTLSVTGWRISLLNGRFDCIASVPRLSYFKTRLYEMSYNAACEETTQLGTIQFSSGQPPTVRPLAINSLVKVVNAPVLSTGIVAITDSPVSGTVWLKTMRLPSGDHRGTDDNPSCVTCSSPVPSAFMM